MIRYLIKNNFKLILRNKWIIIIMILGPMLVSAALGSAFDSLMKSYEKADTFQVGYRIEEENPLTGQMEVWKEAAAKEGIELKEFPEGKPETVMDNNDLAGFVELDADSYTIYESKDYEVEGMTLEYYIGTVIEQMFDATATGMQQVSVQDIKLPVEKLKFMPAIEAKDYYVIIEIVYFIWCGLCGMANVLSSEKKNGIEKRYQLTSLSGIQMFLAKWIPCVIVTYLEIAVSAVVTSVLLDVSWGNIGVAAGLLLLITMAGIAFGLLLYYIFRNLAVTMVVLFSSVWVMGFFGGSFETYMFANYPEKVKMLSPIYYADRTLVEQACMGESTYTVKCILCMLVVIGVSILGCVIADKIRKEGRA